MCVSPIITHWRGQKYRKNIDIMIEPGQKCAFHWQWLEFIESISRISCDSCSHTFDYQYYGTIYYKFARVKILQISRLSPHTFDRMKLVKWSSFQRFVGHTMHRRALMNIEYEQARRLIISPHFSDKRHDYFATSRTISLVERY